MHYGHTPKIRFDAGTEEVLFDPDVHAMDVDLALHGRTHRLALSLQIQGPEHAHAVAKVFQGLSEELGRHYAPQHEEEALDVSR